MSLPTTGRNITLNVCRSIVTDLWNPQVDRPQDVGGFYRGAHGDVSIGYVGLFQTEIETRNLNFGDRKVNTTLQVRDGHPVLVMVDGSSCPQSDNIKASTAIRFSCDPKATEGKCTQYLPEQSTNSMLSRATYVRRTTSTFRR